MRNLSAAAISQMQTRLGTEPIVIIEIAWNHEEELTRTPYADRDIGTIPGKILDVSAIDNVISISQSEDTAEMDVTLDDTDGSIKNLMNQYDIHKRDVWVYHWFEGMDLAEKFLLFRGKISSPVTWNEGDQTVSFSIVSQIEDKEVGFSPEEGQFPFVPRDMVGQVWPSIFGTGIDVPAIQCNKAITGTTLCPVGIISGVSAHLSASYGNSPPDTRQAWMAFGHHSRASSAWSFIDNSISREHLIQSNEAMKQARGAEAQWARAQACASSQRSGTVSDARAAGDGCNPVRILGGEDFPRGGLTLVIGGAYFTGYFSDVVGKEDMFHITGKEYIADEEEATREAASSVSFGSGSCDPQAKPPQRVTMTSKIPCRGVQRSPSSIDTSGNFVINGECVSRDVKTFFYAAPAKPLARGNMLQHFWADAGTAVSVAGDEPITYIVSIVPGAVLQVKAFKNFHGLKTLTHVPSDLYEVREITYGSISTVQVVVSNALSTIEDQEWDDDIYVTFESSVGPNICDIIKYLIDTYSDMTYDSVSFDEVALKLVIFPANFALLDRKNIVSVLNEIAFQARCSLRLIDGVFYIRYLAEEPTAVDTITEKDIENNTVSVELTPTEDIVTKYTALWRVSYAQPELNKLILRHNVRKYGIQEENYEYYIYNQPDIIHKVATFWMIRKSNTWKRLKFNTFLQKINLEAFDAVTLDFNKSYIANGPVKGILEMADLDTGDQTMTMECWLPVKSGEMEAYEFAWPAQVPYEWVFPTNREIELGLAGGDNIGANAIGELPIGSYESLVGEGVVYMGGPNQGMGPQSDRGDPHPSDLGFVPRPPYVDSTYANVSSSDKPYLDLSLNGVLKIDDPDIPIPGADYNIIYLDKTRIRLATNTNQNAYWYLGDVIKAPSEGFGVGKLALHFDTRVQKDHSDSVWGRLTDVLTLQDREGGGGGGSSGAPDGEKQVCIASDAHVYGDDQNKQFDFKYDEEGEMWGCGTCFLQE